MTEPVASPARRPGLGFFFLLALPGLVYYPFRWLDRAPTGSLLWRLSDTVPWIALLSPVCLIAMVVRFKRSSPAGILDYLVPLPLILFTGFMALQALSFIAMFLP